MARMIRVDRKAYTTKKGVKVPRTVYKIKDRGAPGRGPKVIPTPLKEGTLGGKGFFKKSATARRRIAAEVAKRKGEKVVQGKLQAVATFTKRTNPAVARKAAADRKWIAARFQGKKRVPYPQGLNHGR